MRPGLLVSLVVVGLVAMPARAGTSSGELLREIQRLQVVGSVLYVAAHPDDENTRLLAYLVGERGLDATYLSMTRGGGGQNLIGTEQGDLLDVVRTEELLAARAIDGADQRFTSAKDFGYSKSAEETIRIWGRQAAVDDVRAVMAELRPDVVITRFGPNDESHGHHVASAILAGDAFAAFEQGSGTSWRPDRLMRNESSWRLAPDTDTSAWMTLDAGGYDSLTGRSWGEVAAASRTMHKSQGFGTAPTVGPQVEWFSAVAGKNPPPGSDPFTGLDLTWTRFPGTRPVIKALVAAEKVFDARDPARVLPALARAHAALSAFDGDEHADFWRDRKLADLEAVMIGCAGLWLTARADVPAVAPGGALEVKLTALARGADVDLEAVDLGSGTPLEGAALRVGAPWTATTQIQVPNPDSYQNATTNGSVVAPGPRLEAAGVLSAAFDLRVAGTGIRVRAPVQLAEVDPVRGERLSDVEVLPPVTLSLGPEHRFAPGEQVVIHVVVHAGPTDVAGEVGLGGVGWTVEPNTYRFDLPAGGEVVQELRATRTGSGEGVLRVRATLDDVASGDQRLFLDAIAIDHPHLPRRTLLKHAEVRLVPVELDRGPTTRIGYLDGSGDDVDRALTDLGYEVTPIDLQTVATADLSGFDAIVTGVRAYNVHPELHALNARLMDYVAKGGRLIVQYNTNNRLDPLTGPVGPAPFVVGRGRVTEQTATMTAIDANSPILTRPNVLGPADFEGWVQERGLYYAESWDPAYQPVFRASDAGEQPLEGGLLVAKHGEGVFVYTGLAFFRQLPAGVPGAARLLANLLALEVGP